MAFNHANLYRHDQNASRTCDEQTSSCLLQKNVTAGKRVIYICANYAIFSGKGCVRR